MGNRILKESLLEGGQLKLYIKYSRERDLVQYFRCQGYNHIAKTCNNSPKYKKYAGNHNIREYLRIENKEESCVVYMKIDHPA